MHLWSSKFATCCLLDSNGYADPLGKFDAVLGAGMLSTVETAARGGWKALEDFRRNFSDWIFGHFSFEMKETQYGVGTVHPDETGFPVMHFFRPEILLLLKGDTLRIGLPPGRPPGEAERLFGEISGFTPGLNEVSGQPQTRTANWRLRVEKEAYLRSVEAIQRHLRKGDAYEVNFCTEHYATDILTDPLRLFHRLNALSPAPFAALYRVNECFVASSSPERFLQKSGDRVISQPMKGTIRRGNSIEEDASLVDQLRSSAKERSENIMAVDLVRNDLSRTTVPGSVTVTELCGVYTFPQVHQLISTVTAKIRPGVSPESVLEAAFPMGSMTGAPKHRVLQLIDRYERSVRGIYSGALGYFTPEGDFDFNVVIRSVTGNRRRRTLSFQTGSGITVYSDPAREWEECLLKGYALEKAVMESLL